MSVRTCSSRKLLGKKNDSTNTSKLKGKWQKTHKKLHPDYAKFTLNPLKWIGGA